MSVSSGYRCSHDAHSCSKQSGLLGISWLKHHSLQEAGLFPVFFWGAVPSQSWGSGSVFAPFWISSQPSKASLTSSQSSRAHAGCWQSPLIAQLTQASGSLVSETVTYRNDVKAPDHTWDAGGQKGCRAPWPPKKLRLLEGDSPTTCRGEADLRLQFVFLFKNVTKFYLFIDCMCVCVWTLM